MPLLDGTERLGVMEAVTAAPGRDLHEPALRALAALAAELIITKNGYGDLFERVRRQRPMSYAAELVWQPRSCFPRDGRSLRTDGWVSA